MAEKYPFEPWKRDAERLKMKKGSNSINYSDWLTQKDSVSDISVDHAFTINGSLNIESKNSIESIGVKIVIDYRDLARLINHVLKDNNREIAMG